MTRYIHLLFLLLTCCLFSCNKNNAEEQSGDLDRLAKLYKQGCTANDNGQVIIARDCFMKVIDTPSSVQDTAVTTLKAKAYKQLGNVFIYQYMAKEATQMYRKAYDLYKSNNDTTGMLYCYRNMGNAFYCMNKPDSCLYFCRLAISLATTAKERYRYEMTELNCLMLTAMVDKADFHNAKRHYEAVVADTSSAHTPAVLMTTAQYYNGIHDYQHCEQTSLEILDKSNVFDKQRAALFLTNIYMARKNMNMAYHYLKEYTRYTDSVSSFRRTETLLRMNALYNYSMKEQENTKLKADAYVYRILLAVALLFVISTVVVLILTIRYNRQQKALMRLKIDHYKSLQQNRKNKNEKEKQLEIDHIKSSEIYKRIAERINNTLGLPNLHEDDWQSLAIVVNHVYPNFCEHLQNICKMNEYEHRVSLLIKIGIQPSVIAELTAHSRESVSATRRRLFEKAFEKKGTPKDWDEFIMSL